jgi:hypothetical protein
MNPEDIARRAGAAVCWYGFATGTLLLATLDEGFRRDLRAALGETGEAKGLTRAQDRAPVTSDPPRLQCHGCVQP